MASNSVLGSRDVPMRVIVCGIQRTGTLSMRTALHALGFHLCYHMHDVFADPASQVPQWIDAFESKYGDKRPFVKSDWDRLLGCSQAVVDMPGAMFGPELAEIYPEAKVVIQYRDPEDWYESVLQTIYTVHHTVPWYRRLSMLFMMALNPELRAWIRFQAYISNVVMGGIDHGREKEKALQWYNSTYEEFRTRIPSHRSMEWRIEDGWRPLCDFLNVPVPQTLDLKTGKMADAPFPRENDRASFLRNASKGGERWMRITKEHILRGCGQFALATAVAYGTYALFKTKL